MNDNLRHILKTMPFSAKFGVAVVLSYSIIAIFAPIIAPFGERDILGAGFQPWSGEHWLGTDSIGRDMLSRIIYGGRNSIGVALITTILSFMLGAGFGMYAAIKGGWVDQFLGRAVDAMMAIPLLIFSLLILTITGTDIWAVILVIAVLDSTRVFRLSRAVAQNIVAMDYIESARLRGESNISMVLREILPNAMAPLIAEFGLRFCFVFLLISALSFLGLGLQPPAADWGSMVRENAILINYGDITPLLPAGAIALLTMGVNFIVDWLLHRSSGLRE